MKQYNRVYAKIDLDAIEYNMEQESSHIQEGTKIVAVIKTDGYGHGAVPIARMLEEKQYIWGYATATLEEASSLRRAGIQKPILVLGCIFPDQYDEMIANDVRPTVYTMEMAEAMSEAAVKAKKPVYFHIKLDTGMGRLGFRVCKESAAVIADISKLPNVVMEGMFTHFAKADMEDKTYTHDQYKQFTAMKEEMKQRNVEITYYHCDNSAGIIDFPGMNQDLVRSGITTYGMYPSEEVSKDIVHLKPAMELISHVTFVKEIEKGTAISYGGTFVAQHRMKVATIPVGYGDGYPRSLSNKGFVLIHGKKARILGRVCMDQFMVDVSDIDDVEIGSRVTLIGKDGGSCIKVETLAELSDRFNYEFVCCISKRVPRIYIRCSEIVEQVDYLDYM